MRYVGVMSGTSVDGLDVAVVDMSTGVPRITESSTTALPAAMAAALVALNSPGEDEIDRAGACDAAFGEFIGRTVLECLETWRISPRDIRAIGCHGQTIRHRPDSTPPFTMQIGDPNRVAETTGIDTVADLRRRDMAAGGQGAPLAPLFHDALFRNAERHRIVVNVGGIANATMLPAASDEILGFDTGPGNALLDVWCRHCKGEPYDRGGVWASEGAVAPKFLKALQNDGFVSRAPPKSTGKELYDLDYVLRMSKPFGSRPEDVQATLLEFTAWSIANAVERWGPGTGDVVVCGGGRHNHALMSRLAANMPGHETLRSDDLHVDGDGLEAAAFAWFAYRTLSGQPSNVPTVTGAKGPRVLGAIYPAG
ncbi:MAG: anhydro-N-acetylmuramic acid kinase [Gammaproteobacteria bacterium]|nr:anhydro-N-acetylmuramic acid kinase [Gammaproteobacteria bacterium]MDE0192171.1 anhydro-N-acetylmuramic acid kinase [Gammaproteobacteria bacterium]